MQVWDSAGTGFIQYDTAHLSEVTMGHVAENGVIQHALMEQLLPNVDRLWPVSALTYPSTSCKCDYSWQSNCMLQSFSMPRSCVDSWHPHCMLQVIKKLSTELLATDASERQKYATHVTEVGCWCAGKTAVFAATTLLSKPIFRSAQTHLDMHCTALLCATSAQLSIMLMPDYIVPISP